MRLTVVGCSPAWPNEGGAQSGYLLEGEGSLLLDCGPGVLSRLRVGRGWPELDAIAITHFHLDHWGDLVPWVWGALHLGGRGSPPPRVELWAPPGGRARLEQFGLLLGFPDMFERVFDVREYAGGERFAAAGFTVTAIQVPHYLLEAYAFRVEDGSRTLAYSGDSGPSDVLVEVGRDADLFLCEATLERGELDGEPRGHLALDETLAAYERSGAKRLVVIHRPQELSTGESLELACDGMVCEL